MSRAFNAIPHPSAHTQACTTSHALIAAPSGVHNTARQGQSSGYVGGNSPVQTSAATPRDYWFAERAHLGTPLSQDELQHGVRAGIISSFLVNE